MNYRTVSYIKNNPNIYRYLRENSYWYKNLNRNPNSIYELENEMKTKYHLTTSDKIEDIGKKINFLSQIIDILN